MACIYHIYSTDDPDTVYIGQTKVDPTPTPEDETSSEKTAGSYNRPLDHFIGLYNSTRENTMFKEWMCSHMLNTIVIEIYDESCNFGISPKAFKNFFKKWTVSYSTNIKDIQITERDGKIALEPKDNSLILKSYLDVAEIMHNYICYKQGNRLLTHQIGGQSLSLVNKNGVVLNTTMSVEEGVSILDGYTNKDIIKAQKLFNKELNKHLWSIEINGRTLTQSLTYAALSDASNLTTSKRRSTISASSNSNLSKEWTKILVRYLKATLPIVRDALDKALVSNNSISIANKIKNLYSEIEDKFFWEFDRNHKGSFNIVNAIVQKLSTQEIRGKIKKASSLNDAFNIIEKILSEPLQGMMDQVSFTNFFKIEEDTVTKEQSWQINKSDMKEYAAKGSNAYGKSLRFKAYHYFSSMVKKVWKDNPSIVPTHFLDNFGEPIILISTYRLTSLLKRAYDQSNCPRDILRQWRKYVEPLMSIYTKNHGTTVGGSFTDFAEIKGGYYGITNIMAGSIPTIRDITNNWNSTDTIDHAEGLMAFRFKDDTWEEIQEWIERGVVDIEVF